MQPLKDDKGLKRGRNYDDDFLDNPKRAPYVRFQGFEIVFSFACPPSRRETHLQFINQIINFGP